MDFGICHVSLNLATQPAFFALDILSWATRLAAWWIWSARASSVVFVLLTSFLAPQFFLFAIPIGLVSALFCLLLTASFGRVFLGGKDEGWFAQRYVGIGLLLPVGQVAYWLSRDASYLASSGSASQPLKLSAVLVGLTLPLIHFWLAGHPDPLKKFQYFGRRRGWLRNATCSLLPLVMFGCSVCVLGLGASLPSSPN